MGVKEEKDMARLMGYHKRESMVNDIEGVKEIIVCSRVCREGTRGRGSEWWIETGEANEH